MNSVALHIDGNLYSVDPNATVLEAARNAGISIPTLCDHATLSPSGACRLCLVEVDEERLEPACWLTPTAGMVIHTMSDRVVASRRHTIAFLLTRAPDNALLLELATTYNASPYAEGFSTKDNCVLCGLCVRACKKVGTEVLQFICKGSQREVQQISPENCLHCDLCIKLCPTGAITAITKRAHDQSGIEDEEVE